MARFPSDTFRITRTGETSRVLQAFGELDLSTGPRLEEVLVTIGVPPVDDLELDLGAVSLVDAYAMRCIQRAARKLADRGCRLRIGAAQPSVRSVLLLVGFDELVPIDDAPRTERRSWSLPDEATRPA